MDERIKPSLEELSRSYQAIEYIPDPTTWETIKNDIFALHRGGSFPETENLEQKLEKAFNNVNNTAVLLYDNAAGKPKKLIGYTFAVPMPYRDAVQRRNIPTAAIDTTAIEEGYRGQGLVGVLMLQMEEILRRKGFEQMERSVVTHNGYADSVHKHYGNQGRLLPYPRGIELDYFRPDRKHFLINLMPGTPIPRQLPRAT